MILSMKGVEKYLQRFISKNHRQKFPGKMGLQRTAALLNLLKNPQEKLKVIHIAGTSGKGSTAFYASLILNSLGFKTGLHISPYLIDFRERFQINNKLISEKFFCRYLNEIIPTIEKMGRSKFGFPSYFEILTALAFYIFQKEKVDYAVIETGMGGLFDATNSVKNKNKLCLITKIGYDHTDILGNTLEKIARQKAGIIQKNNPVLSAWQEKNVKKILQKQVLKNKNTLDCVERGINFKNIRLKNNKISFDFNFNNYSLKNIELKTSAKYQAENCALALAAICFLGQRDKFSIKERDIKNALKSNSLMGRMDTLKINKKIVVLDGAHNPQKMQAFLESLREKYPSKKFSFLISFKRGKDYEKMLHQIIPLAKNIIITTFKITGQDSLQFSEDPNVIAEKLEKLGFYNYEIVSEIKRAQAIFLKKSSPVLVVTGSLYLIGKIYPIIKNRFEIISNNW